MQVVRTALLPPRIEAGVVLRPRLIENLRKSADRKLTLIQAPAGFGKSTILLQWQKYLAGEGSLTAWLSLDRHISDVMAYVISALSENIGEFRERLTSHFGHDAFATTEAELSAAIECLSRIEKPVHLLIDDVHMLSVEGVRVIGRLIDRLPSGTTVTMATRESPELPLARLRAHGALNEIGMNELRFTVGEAKSFLAASSQNDLAESDIESLVTRTEGWAAGLKLANLTMSREPDRARLIASFSGSNSVVADFFSEDVFGSQPEDLQQFLLKTCLLDRICADLCNAVTGRSDSRELLARIEAAGLFLVRLDNDQTWYRYHGLFSGFLSRRLADVDRSVQRAIHLKASQWFFAHGQVIEAVDHSVRSGDQAWLAEILEQTCEDLIYNGKLTFLVRQAETLERKILLKHPRILLAIAWLRTRNLRCDDARQMIDLAAVRIEEMRAEGLDEEQYRQLGLMLSHRTMMLAAAQDNFAVVENLGEKLLREIGDAKPYITCTLYGQMIRAQREQFKYSQIERLQAKARAVLEKSGYKFAFVALQAIVGPTLFSMGRGDAARRALEYGVDQAVSFAGVRSGLAALPALPLAELAYERNDLDAASELIKDYLPVAREFGFVDELMSGYLVAPKLHFARGDIAAAFRALDDAKSVALELGLERLATTVLAERIRLLLRTGHNERALELGRSDGVPADQRAVGPQISSTTRDDIRAVTWVRLAISQGDIADALGLAQRWRQFCAHRGAVRHLIRWNVLHAQLLLMSGDLRAAQRSLREALVAAAEGGLARVFLDEGVMVHELLAESYGKGPLTKHPADLFAYDLLSAFENRSRSRLEETDHRLDSEMGIDGKMTGREIEILNFVASGLRNREIGDRLGLTEGSVKWYMQRIYNKVGTRRRSVAVERARQFGLLE